MEKLVNELEAETAALRQSENQLESARAEHFAAGDALHDAQGELYAANAEVAKLEQQLQHQRETHSRLASQLGAWRNQQSQLQQQREQAEENLAQWRDERETAQFKMEESADTVGQERERLPNMEAHSAIASAATASCSANWPRPSRRCKSRRRTAATPGRRCSNWKRGASGCNRKRQACRGRTRRNWSGAVANWKNWPLHWRNVRRSNRHCKPGCPRWSRRNSSPAGQRKRRSNWRPSWTRNCMPCDSCKAAWSITTSSRTGLADTNWKACRGCGTACASKRAGKDALESVLGERLKASRWKVWKRRAPGWPMRRPRRWRYMKPDAAGLAVQADGTLTPVAAMSVKVRRRFWMNGCMAFMWPADPRRSLGATPGTAARRMLVCREGHVFTRYSVNFHAPQTELHGVLARQREIEALAGELEQAQAELATRQGEAAQAEAR